MVCSRIHVILQCASQENPVRDKCAIPCYFTSMISCDLSSSDRKSCAELKKLGADTSGVYNITPVPGVNLKVFCDQETDGGGWTVIQKRMDGSVDFYRRWDDYKRGFGNKNGEYWLGLEAIHKMTNSEAHDLRVGMKKFDGKESYAVYSTFKVGPESEMYKLTIGSKIRGKMYK